MSGIQSSFYAVGIALCLFSTGILNGRFARGGQRPSYFAIYLTLEALCFVFELLVAHPATPLKALWLGLLMALSLLIAPSLWLAVKETVEGARPHSSSLGWRHRAPIVIGCVLTLPLIETAHLGVDFVNPVRVVPTLLEPLIHETMLLCIAIFAVQVPFYLWRCRRLLSENRAVISDSYSWLHIPLIIVCTTWLMGVVRTLTGAFSAGSTEFFVLVAVVDVSVTVGCVYLMVKRIACAVQPRLQATACIAPVSVADERSVDSKYAKSQLDAGTRARIVRKLEAAFGADEIYQDARLSLGSLSRHIKENEHYVSQVINQELDRSFYEFVNQHRIDRAKRLLVESPCRNVLDIALSVGFNAKSTFNNAFRRSMGMTPSEFRRSMSPPEQRSTHGRKTVGG